MNKINRRQFLYGTGVSMMLPQLESFATSITKAVQPPKRFLALYVGHGFALTPNDAHPSRDLCWYPRITNDKLTFGPSMSSMQPFADKGQLSVFVAWITHKSRVSTDIPRPTLFSPGVIPKVLREVRPSIRWQP